MTDIAIEIDGVFKKFKKGELYDSLRDLLPALTGRFLGSTRRRALEEREFWALNDVSFQVARGEAFGIIGPNGAGKSTMLKILSRIIKPTRGSIIVNGTVSALIEVSAGFHPDLTGRENIFLNGTILGMSRDEIKRRFDQIVDFSGLDDFIDTPVKRYSSGMYARLGFSVAAHVDPDILIVDEVLSVGDWAFQQRCMERMTEVVQSGATVLFVSHNLRAVSGLCERSLLLERGRVAEIGPSEEVVRSYLTGAEERRRTQSRDPDLEIRQICLRGEHAPKNHFQSGEKAHVDIQVESRGDYGKLSVGISIKTGELYKVFMTSTEGAGCGTFSLRTGESLTCTFALDLHLAPGTYYLSCWVFTSGLGKTYDGFEGAETFFVSSDREVQGVANLYPDIVVGSPTTTISSKSES